MKLTDDIDVMLSLYVRSALCAMALENNRIAKVAIKMNLFMLCWFGFRIINGFMLFFGVFVEFNCSSAVGDAAEASVFVVFVCCAVALIVVVPCDSYKGTVFKDFA